MKAFSSLSLDDPAESLYVLAGGTEVSVEITALEPGKTAMKLRGTVLDAVGESVVLGTQGAVPPNDIGDQHPELQLLLATFTAGGQPVDTYFPCLIPAPHAE